jgi:hypothetical protein
MANLLRINKEVAGNDTMNGRPKRCISTVWNPEETKLPLANPKIDE